MKIWNEIGLYTVETRYERATKSWRTSITGPRFDVQDEDGRHLASLYSGTTAGANLNHSDRIRDAVRLEAFFTRENENHEDGDGDEARILDLSGCIRGLPSESETSNSRGKSLKRVAASTSTGL